MTDTDADIKYTTWLLGDWKPKKMDLGLSEDVCDAASFLRGETDLGLSHDTAHALRVMFSSQERWRSSVETSLKKLVAHIQSQAAPTIQIMQRPANTDVERAQQWRAEGAYEAHTETANHVMHVIESGWVLT